MRKLITFIFATFVLYVNGQQLKKPFSIFITDNYNMQFLANEFRLTNDSLIITAVNDKGVTHIDYLKRKLTRKEKNELKKFLSTYNTDSLKATEYFGDFKNLKLIDYSHYPKIINLEMKAPGLSKKIKVTNCYVFRIADLIDFINPMLPPEVRIKYKKDDFDQTY